MTMPGVVVDTGISIQLTIPASVSKAIGPVLMESMEVIPEPESYSNAPSSTLNPPMMEVVATLMAEPLDVSILKIGLSVVEVAKVKAYFWLLGMVVVAALR